MYGVNEITQRSTQDVLNEINPPHHTVENLAEQLALNYAISSVQQGWSARRAAKRAARNPAVYSAEQVIANVLPGFQMYDGRFMASITMDGAPVVNGVLESVRITVTDESGAEASTILTVNTRTGQWSTRDA